MLQKLLLYLNRIFVLPAVEFNKKNYALEPEYI